MANQLTFVAYYRVSTERQGQSGLGLDAQKAAVAAFMRGKGELEGEFVEVESGRKDDRPQLAAALALCRGKLGRVLVIAKLDRLARSVAFISNLMESGVAFVAVDMPHANKLTMHVLAAVAEHEREMISQRTKAALAAAKARGTRLGNPRPDTVRMRAAVTERVASFRAGVLPTIRILHAEGRSLRGIAAELNGRGIRAPRGGIWYPAGLRSYLLEGEQ
jgi:DNA invertase Pin-like site-specific DNA recombinase